MESRLFCKCFTILLFGALLYPSDSQAAFDKCGPKLIRVLRHIAQSPVPELFREIRGSHPLSWSPAENGVHQATFPSKPQAQSNNPYGNITVTLRDGTLELGNTHEYQMELLLSGSLADSIGWINMGVGGESLDFRLSGPEASLQEVIARLENDTNFLKTQKLKPWERNIPRPFRDIAKLDHYEFIRDEKRKLQSRVSDWNETQAQEILNYFQDIHPLADFAHMRATPKKAPLGSDSNYLRWNPGPHYWRAYTALREYDAIHKPKHSLARGLRKQWLSSEDFVRYTDEKLLKTLIDDAAKNMKEFEEFENLYSITQQRPELFTDKDFALIFRSFLDRGVYARSIQHDNVFLSFINMAISQHEPVDLPLKRLEQKDPMEGYLQTLEDFARYVSEKSKLATGAQTQKHRWIYARLIREAQRAYRQHASHFFRSDGNGPMDFSDDSKIGIAFTKKNDQIEIEYYHLEEQLSFSPDSSNIDFSHSANSFAEWAASDRNSRLRMGRLSDLIQSNESPDSLKREIQEFLAQQFKR